MRAMHLVAVAAALACTASASFRGPFAAMFNTWHPAKDVQYVHDFDHLSVFSHPEVHAEEHTRKKRNAVEAARFAAGNPITRVCDRPGYTGQYCEFPICAEFNPFTDPEQYLRDDGYVIDVTDLGNCSRSHEIIVDETMYDIHIEVQSLENVSPQLTIMDANGYIGTPDQVQEGPDFYIVHFKNLSPGMYTVQPVAASINSRCMLTTTAQTTLTLSGGFQTDERDRNDFPNHNAGAHQFNSILLHLNGGRSPAELKTVSVIGPDNFMFRPRLLDKRYGCQYEYYFDSLFCYNRGSYAMIVEGIDFNGNPFRRTAPFECTYQPGQTTPKAPTTTPAPTNPAGCNNGGILVFNGGESSCVCQDHFTGFDCSQPLCINGGTLIEGKCFCSASFEGEHCEQVTCEPNSNHGFGVDKPTLVFVVRVREEMNGVMKQVQRAVDLVVQNLMFDPEYLTRFHVVFFNDYTNFMSKHYDSITAFDNDFIKATISSNTNGGCTDAVLGAVTTGLTDMQLTQGSMIYVITDALADDYDTNLDALLQFNSYWRAEINFVYVDPTADSHCEADLSDPGFRAFEDVANRFGGMAWHIDDRSKVFEVLYGHMNSILYKSQLVLTVDREECGNGLGKVIQLEKTTENIVIVAKGRSFALEIINPVGEKLQFTEVVSNGLFSVWQSPNPLAGAYYIKASTSPATAQCNFRAYQTSFQTYNPTSPTEAFWAITTDVDSDAWLYQPISGTDNHPVFHVENFGDFEDYDHAFAFLNMYAVRNGVEQEVYASNGLFRSGCSFHFYFPSFRCRPNENLHYEFNLRNEEGFYIQRAGVMTCFNSIPTPAPPSECQNGGVMVNGTCLCLPQYSGEKCQDIICENNGTPLFGICQCPAGWIGMTCSTPQCNEAGPLPNYGYGVDMAFLVEVTQKGVEQIKQLITTLPEIMRDVNSQHPDWIDRLVLIGYNSTAVVGMVDTKATNTKKFFDTLNEWGNSNPEDDGCLVKIWPAIYRLLNVRMDGNQYRELPDRSIINIFEASIPDNINDPFMGISTSEELLERKTITNVFQYRDTTSSTGWRCEGNQTDMAYVEQLARRGDGKMYTIGNGDIGRAIRMIPTLFSSSIVYKYHSDDCTQNTNIFFPVDSYTQTVTAVIAGHAPYAELRRYDHSLFTEDGSIEILNDGTNLVIEYRNPCSSAWDSISQYCVYFNPTYAGSFASANILCQHMNSYMADDLSKEKNDWFKKALPGKKAYLGLTYVQGQWVFQHDGGTSMPVPANINYWADGKIPDGSQGSCAYVLDGVWYPTSCTTENIVVCQKHMFDSSNEPSNLGDDDMSPGKYYLTVKTEIEGAWKGCDVEIRVQSDLNVEFGFVDGLRKDVVHPVANIDSDANRVVSSISIGKEKTDLSLLQTVSFRSDDAGSTLLESGSYSYRLGCVYDWVSQPMTCEETNGEDFSVVMVGEDDSGNTFQRYSTAMCYKWYVCFNGGVYSNGQCICPDFYTGEDCRTPICQNGGSPALSGRKCHCEKGYGGDACQFVQCDAKVDTSFTNDGKALILVVEKSEHTADAIRNIANQFENIVATATDAHQDWLKKFMLITFTVSGSIEDLALYQDPADLAVHLEQVAQEAASIPGACQGPIWSALDHLFGTPLSQYLGGAEVLLISAASPLDADLDSIHAVMEKFGTDTPVVDFIHVESTVCYVNDWAKGLSDFANFLSTVDGTFFRVQPESAGESLNAFLSTRYAPQRISYSDALNCQNNEIFVQIDTGMNEVYVMLSGNGARIEVETPMKDAGTVRNLWTSDEQNLWRIDPAYPGIYKVTVNSNNRACFPMVYGNGGAQVFFGFIQNYNYKDTPKPYAVFGAVNYPVFYLYDHKTGTQATEETLYMAHMDRQSITGKYEDSYDSDIDWRDGCSYNYVGKAFTCQQENDVITMSASGVDSFNQPFTRQTTTYCKKDAPAPGSSTQAPPTSPTSPQPTTTALTPATLSLDVLFIVDETEDAGFIKNVAEPFIEKTLSIYTTSQRFTRVGLITMPHKSGLTMPVAFLSSIDSKEALDEDLTSLEDFNIPGDGEYLTQALSFANDPLKYRQEEHGYREYIGNHLIVILTEKNKFADKSGAIDQIQKIASAQSYGVIAVGYGNEGEDWGDLSEIAGSDCVSVVSTPAALLDESATLIQQKIWAAAFNGGKYCTPANIAKSSRNL